jgi:hypothetical protein
MKAITIQQPSAWAIIAGHKRVENRGWAPNESLYGQVIAIHAAKKVAPRPWTAEKVLGRVDEDFVTSAIIGVVTLAGAFMLDDEVPGGILCEGGVTPKECRAITRTAWWFGPAGFVLRDPKCLKQPVPCKGQLGFWNVPPELERQMRW